MQEQTITDVKTTKSKKQRLYEIEEIMNKENIGLSGWLLFVLAGLIFEIVLCLAGIFCIDGYIIAFAIPLILASAALVCFYKQNKNFRWLYIAETADLTIVGLFVVSFDNFVNMQAYNIMLLIHFAPLYASCIYLLVAKRFKATFCETGKEIVLERRKNLVGTDGWLLIVLLQLFMMLSELIVLLTQVVTAFFRYNIITTGIKTSGIPYLMLIPIALVVVFICIVLFRKRKLKFRFVYIACVVLYSPIKLMSIQSSYLIFFIIVWAAVQGIIIYALFNSHRVKNTFAK